LNITQAVILFGIHTCNFLRYVGGAFFFEDDIEAVWFWWKTSPTRMNFMKNPQPAWKIVMSDYNSHTSLIHSFQYFLRFRCVHSAQGGR
jgi:hypothetical protein